VAVARSVGITKQNRPQQDLTKTGHNRLGLQNYIAVWNGQRDINILKIEMAVNMVGKKI